MKAVVFAAPGGPEVLQLVDRPEPSPGEGEVLVRIAISGVNPTDWKSRRGMGASQLSGASQAVPNQDGAGTVVAVGEGVDAARVGQRVWLYEAAFQRAEGTAQELVCLPAAQAVPLPDHATFDLGATLGIPALTAHRALTLSSLGPSRLGPGTLDGLTVLVAGGAGAVGHMAIELARWAGASVLSTVSSPAKADLALQAGAHHVFNYREQDVAMEVRAVAPGGVDIVVEVAPVANAELDCEVVAPHGVIAAYASTSSDPVVLPVRPLMTLNAAWQFLLVYTVPPSAKQAAVEDVSAAVRDGALHVGEDAGLPLHRFALEQTAAAHAAVEAAAVGKVLIDIN